MWYYFLIVGKVYNYTILDAIWYQQAHQPLVAENSVRLAKKPALAAGFLICQRGKHNFIQL